MKIALLQLSDIHLSRGKNPILQHTNAIANSVKAYAADSSALIIVVTGDVVNTGKEDEYEIANSFLDTISASIKTIISNLIIYEVIIPGNHDFDQDADNSVRDACLKKLSGDASLSIDENLIKELTRPQNNFFNFLHKERKKEVTNSNRIVWEDCFECDGKKISFLCINTSALFQRPSEENRFPVRCIPKRENLGQSVLSIALMHHSYSWFQPDSARELRTQLENISDYVFVGHEHIIGGRVSANFDGTQTFYVEGGTLQPHNDYGDNGFNLLKFDMDQPHELDVIRLRFRENHFISEEKYKIQGHNERKHIQEKTPLESHFSSYLNDLGCLIKHPAKDNLTLSDLFVFPTLKQISISTSIPENTKDRIIKGTDIFNEISNKKNIRCLILGDDGSGKTSLSKKIFTHLHSSKKVPVYIQGKDIKKSKMEDVEFIVKSAISNCYSKCCADYVFLHPDKIFIIDDFDLSILAPKFKSNFVLELSKISDNIIIFADSFFDLHKNLLDSDPSAKIWVSFDSYKICEFNRLLQYEVVRKWEMLGSDVQTLSETELLRLIDNKMDQLRAVFKRGLVPYTPFYIISILQTLESYNSPLNNWETTYGGCYQALVTIALSRVTDVKKIDMFFSFLKEFAYFLYSNDKTGISDGEANKFIDSFIAEYQLTISPLQLLKCLYDACILEKDGDIVKYKYKYIFYFFIAKYLADNIHLESIVNDIKNIFSNLHVQKKAYIATFLTYHTKNPLIINLLVQQAQEIFSKQKPIELDSDVGFIGELNQDIPKAISIPQMDFEKNRESSLRAETCTDEAEIGEDKEMQERRTPDSALDDFAQLVYGAKLIEIIGQVLRCYYGSLKKDDKEKLVMECCDLALRSLSFIFNAIQSNREALISFIESAIEKVFIDQAKKDPTRKVPSKEEIVSLSREFVFDWCVSIANNFTGKVAACIGAKELERTFWKVFNDSEKTKKDGGNKFIPSYRLINLAIKLNLYNELPKSELEGLIIYNPFVFQITRLFVLNRLYMFPVDYKDRQWISDKLKIQMLYLRAMDSGPKSS